MKKIITILVTSLLSTASMSIEWYSEKGVSSEFKYKITEKMKQMDPAERASFKDKLKSLSMEERQDLMNRFRGMKKNGDSREQGSGKLKKKSIHSKHKRKNHPMGMKRGEHKSHGGTLRKRKGRMMRNGTSGKKHSRPSRGSRKMSR